MRPKVANKSFTALVTAALKRVEPPLGNELSVVADTAERESERDAATDLGKRAFDLVVASLLILLLAPALLLISVAIFIESGGPVFFRQARGGLGGREFSIFKFRTMRTDGDIGWTQRGDSRITLLGGLLRRTSIDELPQLFNVVLGDMSLVGPRPHASQMDDEYRALIYDYDDRLDVRPGITGLAQVSDLRGSIGDLSDMRKRVTVDVAYIRGWSFGLDLKILARTIPHLLESGNSF